MDPRQCASVYLHVFSLAAGAQDELVAQALFDGLLSPAPEAGGSGTSLI